MNFEVLRAFALEFDGAREDFPWEWGHPVFKTAKGKIFVMATPEGDGFRMSLKLTLDEASEALTFPFVSVAPYVGRYGWVSVAVHSDAEWDIAIPWIRRSYDLVTGPAKRPRQPNSE